MLRIQAAPAVLLATALITGTGVRSVSAQLPQEITGTLLLVWGDPRSQAAGVRHAFSLLKDDGVSIPLALDGAALESGVDPFVLAGRRVSVLVSRPEPDHVPTAAGAPAVRAFGMREAAAAPNMPLRPMSAARSPQARPYVTILCAFPDWDWIRPATAGQVATRVGTAYPGVAHYWLEASDGRADVSGPVVGWYTLPRERAVYQGSGDAPNLTLLATDCAAAADADVFFPDYAGINFLFNTDIGCCNWGGTGGLSMDGQARSYGMTWLAGDVASQLGTFAHEVGHTFGLPHSAGPYGILYDSKWDIMSNASWYEVPGTQLRVGSHTNAYHKDRLGWIPPERRFDAPPGTHHVLVAPTALPDAEGYLLVRIATPAFSPWEYYTLEARGETGYDAPLTGAGIVLHRVGGGGATPSNALDLDGNGDVNDKGAVLEVGELFIDRANGVTVSVDGREGKSFRVTIRQDDYPRVIADTTKRFYRAVAGEPVLWTDSLRIALGGAQPGDVWRARLSYGPGLEVLTPSGLDGDWLRWAMDTRAMPAGRFTGAIRIEHRGASLDVAYSLEIATVPGLLVALVRPLAEDSAVIGAPAPGASYLLISGPGADTARWTLSTGAAWIRIPNATGTGSGPLAWDRAVESLEPGLHRDSIRIDVPGALGSPLYVRDAFRLLERPSLTALRVGASSRARQGGPPVDDSIHVALSGRFAAGGVWYANSPYDGHVRPSFGSGTGDGWFRFTRDPGTRTPGVHVTSIHLFVALAPEDSITLLDTLVVEATPPAVRAYPSHRSTTVYGASEFSRDSVYVHPEGPGTAGLPWRASFPFGRINPHSYYVSGDISSGTGPRWLYYVRVLDRRAPGLYVDTIRLSFANGGDAGAGLIIDSLTVLGPPALAMGPRSGKARARAGSTAPILDSATIALTGIGAEAVSWTAARSAPWIELVTTAGMGPGTLRWVRHPEGLASGTYVDTIRVFAAAAGSPALLVDSLEIAGPLTVISPHVRPTATMGAPYEDTLRVEGGDSDGVVWRLTAGTLPPALRLDSLSGRVTGIPEASGSFVWTAEARSGVDTASAEFTTTVIRPALDLDVVMEALIGGGAMRDDHKRFLDLLGNRNGRLDVGDVAAWLADVGTSLGTEPAAVPSSAAQRTPSPREVP